MEEGISTSSQGGGYDLSFKFHITQLPIARVLGFLGDAHMGSFDRPVQHENAVKLRTEGSEQPQHLHASRFISRGVVSLLARSSNLKKKIYKKCSFPVKRKARSIFSVKRSKKCSFNNFKVESKAKKKLWKKQRVYFKEHNILKRNLSTHHLPN